MKNNKRFTLTETLIAFIIIALPLLTLSYNYATIETNTFTIEEKEVKVDYSGENPKSMYLLFTDKGVYSNTDSIWFFKFNSSDVYGQLKVGETYTCKTNKLRIPFFSMYKNIIRCDKGE